VPQFLPPNDKHVTFSFDASSGSKLWAGAAREVTNEGYPLGEQAGERRTIRWETVHDCRGASKLKLCISGRARICCPEHLMLPGGEEAAGALAFRICTRGCSVFESLRTKSFTHTAHVVTSGVYFSLGLQRTIHGLILCPRITLLLSSGEEVCLVEDRLGPVKDPQEFFLDFSIVDVASRNLQMDLIIRGQERSGVTSGEAKTANAGTWTLRTCLQEYSTFNSQAEPGRICIASSDLGSVIMYSSAHLQNLVISEEQDLSFDSPSRDKAIVGKVLFGGSQDSSEKLQEAFWHHVLYGQSRSSSAGGRMMGPNPMTGEFLISKDIADQSQLYFSMSGTVAQALLGCVIFRFTCPPEYISAIENQAVETLRETHIPSRGIVLGVEQDPRHGSLLRMFIEYTNEILEDIVVCEFKAAEAYETRLQQEVYDSGDTVYYRITVQHPDGSSQTAELELCTEMLEDPESSPRYTPRHDFRQFAEPSWRFPIAPCPRRNLMLAKGHHIFVYSSVAFQEEALSSLPKDDPEGLMGVEGCEEQLLSAYASPAISSRDVNMEDWQSVGGGTDCECEDSLEDPIGNIEDSKAVPRLWTAPLLDSVMIMSEVEAKPW